MTSPVDLYSQLGLQQQQAETRRTELGQEDFLRLMTEQLKHQDPLKPLGSQEFIGQLAQFSTVKGIENLQGTVTGLANVMGSDQLLGAAAMIDKHAVVESDSIVLGDDGTADGAVAVTEGGDVTVTITNAAGEVVKTINLANQPVGMTNFSWDGIGPGGERLPPGTYKIAATVTGSSGASAAAPTFASARIESVSISTQGPVLNLVGIGPVPMSQVFQIGG